MGQAMIFIKSEYHADYPPSVLPPIFSDSTIVLPDWLWLLDLPLPDAHCRYCLITQFLDSKEFAVEIVVRVDIDMLNELSSQIDAPLFPIKLHNEEKLIHVIT